MHFSSKESEFLKLIQKLLKINYLVSLNFQNIVSEEKKHFKAEKDNYYSY